MHGFPLIPRPCARIVLLSLLCAPFGGVAAHDSVDRQIEQIGVQLEADPSNAELYLRRGELHRIHRDWPRAKADYLKARSLDPSLPAVDLCLGELYLDSGEPGKAVKALNRFLQRSPDHLRGLLTRARAHAELEKTGKAIADYDAALELDLASPILPEAYLERARLLVAQGPDSYDRAVAGLDEGLGRLGEPVTLQLLAIDLEQRRQRWDDAIARIDRIAAQSQRKESWWIRKGDLLREAGRPADAIASYRMALTSIQQLPETRRHNRAVQRLETTARDAISALEKR